MDDDTKKPKLTITKEQKPGKVIEFDDGSITPKAVLKDLLSNIDRITGIACVVEWEDGMVSVAYSDMPLRDFAFLSNYFNYQVHGKIADAHEDEPPEEI